MKRLLVLLVLWAGAGIASAQPFEFSAPADDDTALSKSIPELARKVLEHAPPEMRLGADIAAGNYADAVALARGMRAPLLLQLYAAARAQELENGLPFEQALSAAFRESFGALNDVAAVDQAWALDTHENVYRQQRAGVLQRRQDATQLLLSEALSLINAHASFEASRRIRPHLASLVAKDDARRFVIQDDVLIRTREGVTLSALVVRQRSATAPQPTSLFVNIYTDSALNLHEARLAAARGYVGMVADSRGKRLSPDAIWPWEHDGKDTQAVLDWIVRQPWSDGQVGMYGGSYVGFVQWATAKFAHPALKTIVPIVSSHPGVGLPMQNNVFQYANYAWPFHVMNNKTLDWEIYNDLRWNTLHEKWFASGRPYREIDAIDGLPNPLLQKQLKHPSFDKYWQNLAPYGKDFAKITIPVLSIGGYFDGANVPTVRYLTEHYRYNPKARHYLVIGPYSHVGAQRPRKEPVVGGYAIDPVAQLNTYDLIYSWFDHVMRGGPPPALLKDRINFQVMGANVWRHAPSIESMSSETLQLYLTDERNGEHHRLATSNGKPGGYLEQTVDLADRKTSISLYTTQAVLDTLEIPPGYSFISEPFDSEVSINGKITGAIRATINKRDMDVTLAFYELTPEGKYFWLGYYLGRASYAHDMSKRKLLTPGKPAWIPFERTPLISRQLAKGSRLLVLLTVNKNAWAEVNHGSGKVVSEESVADAGAPLHVRWHNDSYIRVPISR